MKPGAPRPGGIFGGLGRLLKRPRPLPRMRLTHEFTDSEFTENEFAFDGREPLPPWDGVAVPLEELLDASEARMAARRDEEARAEELRAREARQTAEAEEHPAADGATDTPRDDAGTA